MEFSTISILTSMSDNPESNRHCISKTKNAEVIITPAFKTQM